MSILLGAQDAEHKQIVDTFDQINVAWAKGDIDAMLARCTDDIEYVNGNGTWRRGKAALRKEWADEWARGAIVPIRIEDSMRTLAPNVSALVTRVRTNAVTLTNGTRVPAGQGLMTIVFVKQGGRWLMASGHTSLLPRASTPTR